MRRIAAVFLPFLRIELVRATMRDTHCPLALVIARPGSTTQTERSLLGNTRIDEVSPQAHAYAIYPGHTIASARAKCAELSVRVLPLDEVREALGRMAEALLQLGTTTSFHLDGNTVWVDVTGCGHLHRSAQDPTGEFTLGERIHACVTSLAHVARVAIADGPFIAAAVAQYNSIADERRPMVVPPGGGRGVLSAFPVSALPLDKEMLRWFTKLGMKTIGDLQSLPPQAIGTRLGGSAAQIMSLLAGEDRAPLLPHVPPEILEESATVEYGIESTEALLFVGKTLCDRLAARLAGRALAVSKLELVFILDRAMAPKEPRAALELSLSTPFSHANELLGVVRSKVDAFTIEAPILSVTLRALEVAPRTATPLHLFTPEAKAERVLPRLVAELEAELGKTKVGNLVLANRWAPGARSRLGPIGLRSKELTCSISIPDSPSGSLLSGAKEPSRLLAVPLAVAGGLCVIERSQLLARLESTEWWTRAVVRRDYIAAWVESFAAMAWIEVAQGEGAARIRGWID